MSTSRDSHLFMILGALQLGVCSQRLQLRSLVGGWSPSEMGASSQEPPFTKAESGSSFL